MLRKVRNVDAVMACYPTCSSGSVISKGEQEQANI